MYKRQFQVFVGKISALMNPVTYIIINGAIIVLIWTGAWQVESGVITQGEVVALVNYMSQILVELVKLANLIIIISKSLASANRISSVFDMTASLVEKNCGELVRSGEETEQPKVEFRDQMCIRDSPCAGCQCGSSGDRRAVHDGRGGKGTSEHCGSAPSD